VREDEANEEKRNEEFLGNGNQTNAQDEPKSERFPEVNIFESLLYSSPNREKESGQKSNLDSSR
jgi:hypothetical protein